MDLRTGSKQLIRDINMAMVMDCVRRHGPVSRVEISDRTGLGRSTITGLVNLLLREELLWETGSGESSGGRKPVMLELNAGARHVLGLKLAPGAVSAAVCDLRARVVARAGRPLPRGQEPAAVLDQMKACVEDALAAAGVSRERVIGVGVALPGVVDPATGTSVSPTFFRWSNLAVRSELEAALRLPVLVENDANAFALAEHAHGAGRGFDHLIAVTVGIGIGSGLIAGGQLYHGARSGAGELGHITIHEGGPQCVCGNAGCLEAMASDAAVARGARAAVSAGQVTALDGLSGGDPARIDRSMVVAAAQAGDGVARRLLAEAGAHLGTGLANALNLLNPQRIVVGGEAVQQAGDLLLEPLRQTLARRSFSVLADGVDVVPAALGDDAWVIGAATLVLEEFFKPPIYEGGHHPAAVAFARIMDT